MVIGALVLAFLSACISVWLYLDCLQRPKKHELRELLEQQSATVLKQYVQQFKLLETEWDDMYEKFSRLAGRMDRRKALESPKVEDAAQIEVAQPQSRADLLRKWRIKK